MFPNRPTGRPANRKRKSSLANVFHVEPQQHVPNVPEKQIPLQKPVVNEFKFEPCLPDATVVELFNNLESTKINNSTANNLSSLPVSIFNNQFTDFHRSKEHQVQHLESKVNYLKEENRKLQNKNEVIVHQGHISDRYCKQLRSNNEQMQNYLRAYRNELLPMLNQLELGINTFNHPPAFNTTLDLSLYLKDLGKRIWEYGSMEEQLEQQPNHPYNGPPPPLSQQQQSQSQQQPQPVPTSRPFLQQAAVINSPAISGVPSTTKSNSNDS